MGIPKRRIFCAFVVGLNLISAKAWSAQSSEKAPLEAIVKPPETMTLTPEEQEFERNYLLELKAIYEQSVSNNELDKLVPYLDPEFTFVTFTDSEFDSTKTSFDQFKSEWNEARAKMLEGGSYSVKLAPAKSIIYRNFAFSRGIAHHKMKQGNGKVFELTGQWTATLRKQDGKWKLLRAHSSINPFANAMIADYVEGKLLQVGGIAFVVGLILGAMTLFLLKKSRSKY